MDKHWADHTTQHPPTKLMNEYGAFKGEIVDKIDEFEREFMNKVYDLFGGVENINPLDLRLLNHYITSGIDCDLAEHVLRKAMKLSKERRYPYWILDYQI